MKALLIASMLLLATATIVAAAPTAAACNPPNCPGFGSCHVNRPTVYVDENGYPIYIEIDPRLIECYY